MLYLDEIADFLHQSLAIEQIPSDDPNGIYRASSRPVQRLGLALEPWPHLVNWVQQESLDALFLHRPWGLELAQLPPELGILAYHLGFDERLTLGLNPNLAAALEMTELEVLGKKAERPIGMIGKVPLGAVGRYCDRLNALFGGVERTCLGEEMVSRVAVVGAMTEALIREARDRGAQLYLTGQWRQVAAATVEEMAMTVVAVGHARCEAWGLRTLAKILSERWSDLQVVPFLAGDRLAGDRG